MVEQIRIHHRILAKNEHSKVQMIAIVIPQTARKKVLRMKKKKTHCKL
jgi:hypothetical protein